MINMPSNNPAISSAAMTAAATGNKQIVLKQIGARWSKFSEQDLAALRSKDDVVAKYSLDTLQAQRDVDALMKGRGL